jgi:uncharacterized protein
MRVAVVGAGVSGLVVAHLLQRAHDVTVFDANGYSGGHTNTVRVDTPNETYQVDTGFVVFNDRNYPNFERLLERLGVGWQRSTMSFSVSDGMGDFEYSSASPSGLFAKREHLLTPWFHRMVADLARFNRSARELLDEGAEDVSLGDWLERHRFSRAFIERLIVPQASAVWSAAPRQTRSLPARFLVEFFERHGMLSLRGRPAWRTVRGGSARYVEALMRPFSSRLRLRTPVDAVTRRPDHGLVNRLVVRQSASTRWSWRPTRTSRSRCCATPVIACDRNARKANAQPDSLDSAQTGSTTGRPGGGSARRTGERSTNSCS